MLDKCISTFIAQGEKIKLIQTLAHSDYGQSSTFWQFFQTMVECLLNGSKEKELLEDLFIGKDA